VDPFITHTGRAMPLRRASVGTGQIIPAAYVRPQTSAGFGGGLFAQWRQDPEFVLNQSAYAGATILIAGSDFESGPPPPEAAWALADHGFRAVISSRFSDILYNDMIQAGIALARLPGNVVDKLLQTVEADPQILIAIDLDRREVRAGGEPCSVFEIDEYARQRLMAGQDADGLAGQLLAAQRRLASCDLGLEQHTRLRRRLMAICDAIKAPGADAAHGAGRLKKFLDELDRAEHGGG
jgi:3-isopropylmalate/(R)-2-methylmalate dehydratase small subunit